MLLPWQSSLLISAVSSHAVIPLMRVNTSGLQLKFPSVPPLSARGKATIELARVQSPRARSPALPAAYCSYKNVNARRPGGITGPVCCFSGFTCGHLAKHLFCVRKERAYHPACKWIWEVRSFTAPQNCLLALRQTLRDAFTVTINCSIHLWRFTRNAVHFLTARRLTINTAAFQ